MRNKKDLLTSQKSGSLSGTLEIPGDKSCSHRAIMLGSLALGQTQIFGLLESEDVLCTAKAMQDLGVVVQKNKDSSWTVQGVGLGGIETPQNPLDMGNSGTSTRLMMGLVAGHAVQATFVGDHSLSKRPMGRVIKPLSLMGASFDHKKEQLPVTVHGTGKAIPILYETPVASAQIKSAILLAGLTAPGSTTVRESILTRDHTENMLKHFGVRVTTEQDNNKYCISIFGQEDLQACPVTIPRDPSSAAFPLIAALINPGSNLSLPGICVNPQRIGLLRCLEEMGAEINRSNERIESGEQVADIEVLAPDTPLKAIDITEDHVSTMIDEFPIFAIAASCANGTTRMYGLSELRHKESDRLDLIAKGLEACGVSIEMGEDSLIIHGTGKPPKGGATIRTDFDHRIAMSFLILGSVTQDPVTVENASSIATSFPDFVPLMEKAGLTIQAA